MGIDLGSVGTAFGKDGAFGIIGQTASWMKDLFSGLGYFVGGDFAKALGKGFMG